MIAAIFGIGILITIVLMGFIAGGIYALGSIILSAVLLVVACASHPKQNPNTLPANRFKHPRKR